MTEMPMWAFSTVVAVVAALAFEAGRLWQWVYDGWRLRQVTRERDEARDCACQYLSDQEAA